MKCWRALKEWTWELHGELCKAQRFVLLRLFNPIDFWGSACNEAPAVKDSCAQRCEHEAISFAQQFFPFFLHHYCLSLRCLFLLVISFGKWDNCLQVLKGILSCERQKLSLLASIIAWLSFWIWSSLGKYSVVVRWGDNSFFYFSWAF